MEVVRPLIIVGVALFIAMIAYSVMMAQQKPQPTVVVRPSQNKSTADVTQPPPVVMAPQTCTTPIMLKIYGTSICAEKLWSVTWTESGISVDFERGTISGIFMIIQTKCTISTSPQGVLMPCRAQILIPTTSR